MRVAVRHSERAVAEVAPVRLEAGELRVDFARREVRLGGTEVHLTPIEFKLLVLLAKHRGKVLTHRQILVEVWGPAYAQQTHYVRVHMAELRKKIEREPARPKVIVTEPGVGYRMRDA
jgi:two-component system KDP operon response regulator KdpE